MKYSKLLIAIVIIGVAIQLPTHLDFTVGEQLFHWLNVPIYSNGESGLHYTGSIGFFAVLISLILLKKIHMMKYPKLFSRSILCIVLLMIIFPSVTKGVSYAVFYSSSSTSVIDIEKERCDLTITDSLVEGNCNITVFNYGKAKQIEVVPILSRYYDDSYKIVFNSSTLPLLAHKTNNIGFQVTGIATNLATDISSARINSPVDVSIIK